MRSDVGQACRGPTRRRVGFSIVELLIAGAVLVTVLAMASVFFSRQVQLQRAVQARNEVQDLVRAVMQIVTQDLSLSGSTVRLDGDGTFSVSILPFGGCLTEGCFVLSTVSGTNSTNYSELAMRYMSSQFPTSESCREVRYTLGVDDTLQRSDVACSGSAAAATPAPNPLAPGLGAFAVTVLCSDGNALDSFTAGIPDNIPPIPQNNCDDPTTTNIVEAYARSAIVSVTAVSRIPVAGNTAPGCPDDRYCFTMTQEILLPNLKPLN